jgi:hypothetical protein
MTSSLEEILKESLTYGVPVVTEPDGAAPAVPAAPGGAPGGGSIDAFIAAAFRRYLGQAPDSVKPEALLGLLSRRFMPAGSGEHLTYVPRSSWIAGGGPVNPDALSGAGKVLAAYAGQTLATARQTASDLQPLLPAPDLEAIDGARTAVLADLDALLADVSQDDVVPETVDFDFTQLGFTAPGQGVDAPTIGRHLGELRDRLGLSADNVRVLRDEQQVFAFEILVQSLDALFGVWQTARGAFSLDESQAGVFLSAQLDLLDRWRQIALYRLDRIATTLGQLGLPAEAVELAADGGARIFLSQLMAWARDVLERGLPGPIDGDELGVDEVADWGARVAKLAAAFAAAQASPGVAPPGDLRWARFQAMLGDFVAALNQLTNVAAAAERRQPTLAACTVQPAVGGQPVTILAYGTRFERGTGLQVAVQGADPVAGETVYVSDTLLVGRFAGLDLSRRGQQLQAVDGNGASDPIPLPVLANAVPEIARKESK